MATKNLLLTCILSLFCINLSYAKWLQTDPKAEKYYSASPYAYCLNNPVRFIDPDGEEIHLYEVAAYRNKLSYFGQGTISNDRMRSIGGFEVSPYLDKAGQIIGWSAYRDGRVQYVMDNPGDINVFTKNVSSFGVAADLFYMNGTPGQGQIAMAAGDIGAGLLRQWGNALRNPGYYMYAASALGVAAMMTGSNGTSIYRVFGDDAKPFGRFWTPINPNNVANYRNSAGLPIDNSGRFVIEATTPRSNFIITKGGAAPIGANIGGLPEYRIVDPSKINVKRVSGVNPQF